MNKLKNGKYYPADDDLPGRKVSQLIISLNHVEWMKIKPRQFLSPFPAPQGHVFFPTENPPLLSLMVFLFKVHWFLAIINFFLEKKVEESLQVNRAKQHKRISKGDTKKCKLCHWPESKSSTSISRSGKGRAEW